MAPHKKIVHYLEPVIVKSRNSLKKLRLSDDLSVSQGGLTRTIPHGKQKFISDGITTARCKKRDASKHNPTTGRNLSVHSGITRDDGNGPMDTGLPIKHEGDRRHLSLFYSSRRSKFREHFIRSA